MMPFMALKTRPEQTFWDWVKKEKPAFSFNTVLLDTVMGECLDPKNQGLPSTAGLVYCAWTGRGFLASVVHFQRFRIPSLGPYSPVAPCFD